MILQSWPLYTLLRSVSWQIGKIREMGMVLVSFRNDIQNVF